MSYYTELYPTEDNIIIINGNEEELVPGLNNLMIRMSELYVENYLEPGGLYERDYKEPAVIDFTVLSDEEMNELISCAAMSIQLEEKEITTDSYLS